MGVTQIFVGVGLDQLPYTGSWTGAEARNTQTPVFGVAKLGMIPFTFESVGILFASRYKQNINEAVHVVLS